MKIVVSILISLVSSVYSDHFIPKNGDANDFSQVMRQKVLKVAKTGSLYEEKVSAQKKLTINSTVKACEKADRAPFSRLLDDLKATISEFCDFELIKTYRLIGKAFLHASRQGQSSLLTSMRIPVSGDPKINFLMCKILLDDFKLSTFIFDRDAHVHDKLQMSALGIIKNRQPHDLRFVLLSYLWNLFYGEDRAVPINSWSWNISFLSDFLEGKALTESQKAFLASAAKEIQERGYYTRQVKAFNNFFSKISTLRQDKVALYKILEEVQFEDLQDLFLSSVNSIRCAIVSTCHEALKDDPVQLEDEFNTLLNRNTFSQSLYDGVIKNSTHADLIEQFRTFNESKTNPQYFRSFFKMLDTQEISVKLTGKERFLQYYVTRDQNNQYSPEEFQVILNEIGDLSTIGWDFLRSPEVNLAQLEMIAQLVRGNEKISEIAPSLESSLPRHMFHHETPSIVVRTILKSLSRPLNLFFRRPSDGKIQHIFQHQLVRTEFIKMYVEYCLSVYGNEPLPLIFIPDLKINKLRPLITDKFDLSKRYKLDRSLANIYEFKLELAESEEFSLVSFSDLLYFIKEPHLLRTFTSSGLLKKSRYIVAASEFINSARITIEEIDNNPISACLIS